MTEIDRRVVSRILVHARDACILALLALLTGCDSGLPTEPSPLAAPPPAAALSILSIAPNAGSTQGGTVVTVTGSGFLAGAAVILDGVRHTASVERTTALQFTTAAHDPGAVDVVVANPGDQTARLAGGFTFAPPPSFDFNGIWIGRALAHPELAGRLGTRHSDMEIHFVIRGDTLISLDCAHDTEALVRPLRIIDGTFATAAGDGAAVTGRIVSASGAVGTIDTPACPATRWSATKQP